MMKTRLYRLTLAVVFVLLALWVWYAVAANYDYGILAGTYTFSGREETCILRLRADRTFEQEVNLGGVTQKSHGNWYRYGESHVSFSSEFLKLSGEEANANGEAHGQFVKVAGIFPVLVLAPIPNGPRLHKKVLLWN